MVELLIQNSKLCDCKIINILQNACENFEKNDLCNLIKVKINLHIIKRNDFFSKTNINDMNVCGMTEKNHIYLVEFDETNLKIDEYVMLFKHELIHALLNSFYPNLKFWIAEGCAVFFSGQLNILFNKKLFSKDKLIKIEKLEKEFCFSNDEYICSGIYIKFLYEKHSVLFEKMIRGKIKIYDFEKIAWNYWMKYLTN